MQGGALNGDQVFQVSGQRFGVVVARFNLEITRRLLDGCLGALHEQDVDDSAVEIVEVPGAFELPQAAAWLAKTGRVQAVICLGAVIRGETPHFEYVARAAAEGIERVALDSGVPTTFGVITAETLEQAMERSDGSQQNRGREAAISAMSLVTLWLRIES